MNYGTKLRDKIGLRIPCSRCKATMKRMDAMTLAELQENRVDLIEEIMDNFRRIAGHRSRIGEWAAKHTRSAQRVILNRWFDELEKESNG